MHPKNRPLALKSRRNLPGSVHTPAPRPPFLTQEPPRTRRRLGQTTTTCRSPNIWPKFRPKFPRIPPQILQSLVISRTSPQHAFPAPNPWPLSPALRAQKSPRIPPQIPQSLVISRTSPYHAHQAPDAPPDAPPYATHSSLLSTLSSPLWLSSAILANQNRCDCLRKKTPKPCQIVPNCAKCLQRADCIPRVAVVYSGRTDKHDHSNSPKARNRKEAICHVH